MAGLGTRGSGKAHRHFRWGITVITALACVLATVCTESLDLKALIRDEVARSKIGLVLYDGPNGIAPGGTVAFPDTIFGDTSSKTLTLRNDGQSNVTLTGPGVVSITGGSGQAAYGNIAQPVQATLLPGGTATFTVEYTPPLADANYVCDFVINSDDPSYPAYVFHGSGNSIQWHGSKAIVSSSSSSLSYSKPKLAILAGSPPTLYLAYKVYSSTAAECGIALRYSRDGGKNWSAAQLVVPSQNVAGFSFAAANDRLHLFYQESSVPEFRYTTSSATPGSINFTSNYVGVGNGNFSFGADAYSADNSSIVVANGKVYLVAYDNTSATRKLYLYIRGDSLPNMGQPNFTQYTVTDGATHTGGFYPSLKVDATTIYISYQDNKVLRAVAIPETTISTQATWAYRVVYTDASSYVAYDAMAIDSGKAYILWSLSDGSVVPRCRSSADLSLAAWSSTTTMTGESSSGTPNVVLLLSGGILYAAWTSYYGGVYTLRLGLSRDGGVTWSNQYIDDRNGVGGCSQSVLVNGTELYVAYNTYSGHPNGYSITLRKSMDGGASW